MKVKDTKQLYDELDALLRDRGEKFLLVMEGNGEFLFGANLGEDSSPEFRTATEVLQRTLQGKIPLFVLDEIIRKSDTVGKVVEWMRKLGKDPRNSEQVEEVLDEIIQARGDSEIH